MARLVLAVVFVAIVLGAVALLALGIRSSAARVDAEDAGKGFDMADAGMLAKVAYALLLILIVYVTLTAAGG